ncbi:carboxylesterase family protein [Fulvimarina sp. MAC8]|uniref:carboxylesterase/lipase family protein n=1 Tax=Fulvimarina sp. MAC8 TaxID=3162874 RepID=UPI0032EBE2EB
MAGAAYAKAPCGLIEGRQHNGVLRFLGIPYAEAPTGQHRFSEPRRRATFQGTFQALRFGPSAPQRNVVPKAIAALTGFSGETSEDCLNLHVFTPDCRGKRPVLVFFHGGGFFIGSGAQYPGDGLARRGDVVVVTINYRLGLLGFNAFGELFAGDERFIANAGLLDQRLALEWVRDNIAAFGGDPDRVTIAGESAGSASVGFHMIAEGSKALFAQAICQSGTINMFRKKETAREIAQTAFEMLVPDGERERLFALPPSAFVEIIPALFRRFPGIPTMPYLDGAEIGEEPLPELFRQAKPVPLLLGTNRDEFTLFTDLKGFSFSVGLDDLSSWVERQAGRERATKLSRLYGQDKAGATRFGTDILFGASSNRLAEIHSSKAPTFVYRLDWRAKGALSKLGATHSVDLPLLFDRFLVPFRSVYLGLLPDPARRRLSLRMQDHWTAFVRSGTPGRGWPQFEPEAREIKVFDVDDRIERDPDRERRLAWEGVDGLVP